MNHPSLRLALCVPTFCAEHELKRTLKSYIDSAPLFNKILFIDSSSSDQTIPILRSAGFEVLVIPSSEFDHGGTRQMGVETLADCEIIVFMTQDAVLVSPDSIKRLIGPFEDPGVAITYGRQLPRIGAKPMEKHNRIFGYPPKSIFKSRDSIPELGIRSAVVSNSFAAYRRSTLIELGGFPSGTLFGEDTLTGAKAVLSGYKIAYVGEATVYHSHDYSAKQEFRRYFDNGAFYSREKWIINTFGGAENSGKAYVISELKYLIRNAPWYLPRSILLVFIKYLGYKIGSIERILPNRLKEHLSMNRRFWQRT